MSRCVYGSPVRHGAHASVEDDGLLSARWDRERKRVGALDRPRERTVLSQGQVSARAVVVVDVRYETAPQAPLVDDGQVVEAFPPDRDDHPFNEGVLPGRPGCRHDVLRSRSPSRTCRGRYPVPVREAKVFAANEVFRRHGRLVHAAFGQDVMGMVVGVDEPRHHQLVGSVDALDIAPNPRGRAIFVSPGRPRPCGFLRSGCPPRPDHEDRLRRAARLR